jgi:rubrerythrin
MPENTVNPVTNILQRAIRNEEDSHTLYRSAAQAARTPHTRDLLNELAQEEAGHKAHLQAMLAGDPEAIVARGSEQKIVDLKIGDYLVYEPLGPDVDFQAVLIAASKREKNAHDFYQAMADLTCGLQERKLFLFLAEQELGHKNRIESIYEETVYKDF